MTDEERVGAAHRGGDEEAAHGIQALVQQTPLDELIAREEADREEDDDVRLETMRRLMLFIFCDGKPEDLRFARLRLYSVVREFYPQVLEGVTRKMMREIFEVAGEASMDARDGVGLVLKGDRPEVRDELLGKLLWFFFYKGKPERAELVMRRVYALAKSFYPKAIHGMSLEELGTVVFREGKPSAARARWSWRIKKMINEFIEASGGVAHAHFQKSSSTCRKYRAAAMGNNNRKNYENNKNRNEKNSSQ